MTSLVCEPAPTGKMKYRKFHDISVSVFVASEFACFTEPLHRIERVSYPCPTPCAAQGILKSIHWKPEMEYGVTRIDVIKPGRLVNVPTIERKSPQDAGLSVTTIRSNLILNDVAYVIHAFIKVTNVPGHSRATAIKHKTIFDRRVKKSQCHKTPHMGLSQFCVSEFREPLPTDNPIKKSQNFGVMLHSIDWETSLPRTYCANMINGVILVGDLD